MLVLENSINVHLERFSNARAGMVSIEKSSKRTVVTSVGISGGLKVVFWMYSFADTPIIKKTTIENNVKLGKF